MANSVLIFPGHEILLQEWQNRFLTAGYKLLPFGESALQGAVAVLLFTPVLTGNEEWITPEPVWKNYMSEVAPDLKLLQLGYRVGVNLPNYLHLEKPPDDVCHFIKNAQVVKEWQYRNTYGQDLRQLWSRFRDGHNKGGFMDWFIVAKRRTKIALEKLTYEGLTPNEVQSYLNSDPETIDAFDNMIVRWSKYFTYFYTGPFHYQLEKINGAINRLNHRWEGYTTDVVLNTRLENMMKDFKLIDEELKMIEPWFRYE